MLPISVTYFAAAAAILAVVMWMDYYRRIDVFEPEQYWYLIVAMIIGAASPFLSLKLYAFFNNIGLHQNGDLLHDLIYTVLVVGLNEEFSKLLAVLLVFMMLRKQLNDAIDYFIYAGLCALGFALVENFIYFENHGLNILSARSFYSVLEHLINTTLIVYGLYRKKLFNKGKTLVNAALAICMAVASHGLFDYFLGLPNFARLNAMISTLIYLIGINFWVQMLNNANNYSSRFNYHKIEASSRLVKRLVIWYTLTLFFTFLFNLLFEPVYAAKALLQSVLSDGLIFLLVIIRVSRFSLIKGDYERIRPKLPFYIVDKSFADIGLPFFARGIRVRGESYRDQVLSSRVGDSVNLFSHQEQHNLLRGMIDAKLRVNENQVAYLFSSSSEGKKKKERYLLVVTAKPIGINEHEGVDVMAYQYPGNSLPKDLTTLKLNGYYHCAA